MARRSAAAALVSLLPLLASVAAQAADITVYRSSGCSCCGKWAQHLRDAGHTVVVNEVTSMSEIKTQLGVPEALASCHTAVVDGYVVEGHVPAGDVARLLEERPAARGIAVPGMPIGSPGMEVEGEPAEAYDVTLFGLDGSTSVFAHH
jgi:hypothetical protein